MNIETPRLRLRELTTGDADARFILRLVSEPAFQANIGDKGVTDLASARRFLREGPWTNQTRPGHGQLLVELSETNTAIGICGLLYREHLDLTDVGFATLSPYWRRGYAFEAASAVLRYGYETLGIESIVALTSKGNLASIRLLEKLGMRFERLVRMTDDDPGTALFSRPRDQP